MVCNNCGDGQEYGFSVNIELPKAAAAAATNYISVSFRCLCFVAFGADVGPTTQWAGDAKQWRMVNIPFTAFLICNAPN